jgi:hypothetical protein
MKIKIAKAKVQQKRLQALLVYQLPMWKRNFTREIGTDKIIGLATFCDEFRK